MPKISNKGKHMPESPIRKLVPYSEIAKKKGNKVYHLNIGQPDIKTPEVAMNSIKNLDIKVLEYSHSAGFESYRTKLSQYYKNMIYQLMLLILLLQQEVLKLCFLQWVVQWIKEMKLSFQNHFMQIITDSLLHQV